MIYVYALTDPMSTSPELRGLEDQPLRTVTVGPVSATFTCHSASTIPPLPQNLWQHERVVESFMRHRDLALLPARFGTTVPGEAHLEEVLGRHQAALQGGLERVRGCVELGLRVAAVASTAPAAPAPRFATGREYMTARLADERRRRVSEQLASELDMVLAPLARETARRAARAPNVVIHSAYLVHHSRADEFAVGVRDLAVSHPSLQLLCTGPWPAYHFAPSIPLGEAFHG
jgi:hypothetical protein